MDNEKKIRINLWSICLPFLLLGIILMDVSVEKRCIIRANTGWQKIIITFITNILVKSKIILKKTKRVKLKATKLS